MKRAVLFVAAFVLATQARADDCTKLAKPSVFNGVTAMRAIFCYYNAKHGGTLLPRVYTAGWKERDAQMLATPLVVATYEEGGKRKGVLAVQRQMIDVETGTPDTTHAEQPVISVYVFGYNGTQWVYEKGKKDVTEAGTFGVAPEGRLVRLGRDKHGLWFDGSDTDQGNNGEYAFIIDLSTPRPAVSSTFDTGQDNSGTCSDDPKEWDGVINGACWVYQATPAFIDVPGAAYYMLRLTYKGTEAKDYAHPGETVPKNNSVCYGLSGQKYVPLKDDRCASYAPVAGAFPRNKGASETHSTL